MFCGIVEGRIPAQKVYEDEHVVAFMDIGPVVKGHVLVVPKRHYDPITGTPDEVLSRLIRVVRIVADAQMKGLKADGINVTQANGRVAGQVVPHIHFHVIPRFEDDRHSWNWKAGSYENREEMAGYAEKITGGMESGGTGNA